jgi:hypothetical protein
MENDSFFLSVLVKKNGSKEFNGPKISASDPAHWKQSLGGLGIEK